MQHPFPAQGHTTDTTHAVIADHATREGSYVALTRAREQTHIYATTALEDTPNEDLTQPLAQRMSRTEPEVPSIHTPLAHESTITSASDEPDLTPRPSRTLPAPAPDQPPRFPSRARGPAPAHLIERVANDRPGRPIDELAPDRRAQQDGAINPADRATTEPNIEIIDKRKRTWPRQIGGGASAPRRTIEQLDRDTTAGWEP